MLQHRISTIDVVDHILRKTNARDQPYLSNGDRFVRVNLWWSERDRASVDCMHPPLAIRLCLDQMGIKWGKCECFTFTTVLDDDDEDTDRGCEVMRSTQWTQTHLLDSFQRHLLAVLQHTVWSSSDTVGLDSLDENAVVFLLGFTRDVCKNTKAQIWTFTPLFKTAVADLRNSYPL